VELAQAIKKEKKERKKKKEEKDTTEVRGAIMRTWW
jgi:hypothetical protein